MWGALTRDVICSKKKSSVSHSPDTLDAVNTRETRLRLFGNSFLVGVRCLLHIYLSFQSTLLNCLHSNFGWEGDTLLSSPHSTAIVHTVLYLPYYPKIACSGSELYFDLKPPKFEHIFVPVIIFFPFFRANTFNTSLLLIVCALKCYVKSLYRHLFLEDISKHTRVTQKRDFLILNTVYTLTLTDVPQTRCVGS